MAKSLACLWLDTVTKFSGLACGDGADDGLMVGGPVLSVVDCSPRRLVLPSESPGSWYLIQKATL